MMPITTPTNDSFNLPYALYDSKAKINLIQPNGEPGRTIRGLAASQGCD